MKIIIIGAEFSGVATYLLLRRMCPPPEHTILLCDAHDPREVRQRPDRGADSLFHQTESVRDSAAVVGNIISLEPPAVRLIRFIDPKLCETFKARSYATRTTSCAPPAAILWPSCPRRTAIFPSNTPCRARASTRGSGCTSTSATSRFAIVELLR